MNIEGKPPITIIVNERDISFSLTISNPNIIDNYSEKANLVRDMTRAYILTLASDLLLPTKMLGAIHVINEKLAAEKLRIIKKLLNE